MDKRVQLHKETIQKSGKTVNVELVHQQLIVGKVSDNCGTDMGRTSTEDSKEWEESYNSQSLKGMTLDAVL